MLPYKVLPMFHLGPLHFNMYGILFATGVLIASLLAVREAKKRGIDPEKIWDLILYLLIGIIVGSRLFYVLFYWPENEPLTLWGAIAIWNGGLAFFGGFAGALTAGYLYIKKHRLRFWEYADIFAIPLVVGHILGRIGDFLTGGHPGKITSLPWGIYLEGAVRHPVVLYEITGLVIILIALTQLKKLKLFEGFTFTSYIVLYSIQRFILDFFRLGSTDPRYLGLTPSQYIVILLFLAAVTIIVFNLKKINNREKEWQE